MSRVCCREGNRSKGGGGGRKAEEPSRVRIREPSGFYLSPAGLQGLLLRPAPSHFPSTRLSSPHRHVCWLGPVSPSCSWVESLWSPVRSDTGTPSRSKPRPRSAALCVGSSADAAGIAASPSSSHLGRGAGALRLRLIPHLLLLLLLLLPMCVLGRSCAPTAAVILGAGRTQGKVSAGLGQGPLLPPAARGQAVVGDPVPSPQGSGAAVPRRKV